MEVVASVNLGTGGLLELLLKKGLANVKKTTKAKCENFFSTYIASVSHLHLLPRSRLAV